MKQKKRRLCVFLRSRNFWLGKSPDVRAHIEWMVCAECQRKLKAATWIEGRILGSGRSGWCGRQP